VLDVNDDIGFHWDRDYTVEDTCGVNVHPHIATVTYLTELGGPTVILEKVGSVMCKECFYGDTHTAYFSWPRSGKHISFDGRWLHGAPSSLNLESDELATENANNVGLSCDETDMDCMPRPKRHKQDKQPSTAKHDVIAAPSLKKRITFLVNVWLNHKPLGSEPLGSQYLAQLSNHSLLDNLPPHTSAVDVTAVGKDMTQATSN